MVAVLVIFWVAMVITCVLPQLLLLKVSATGVALASVGVMLVAMITLPTGWAARWMV